MTTTTGAEDPGWSDPPTVVQRRQLLELIMVDGIKAFEDWPGDGTGKTGIDAFLPYALQAICGELVQTSLELYEARETINDQKSALEGLGAMYLGLLLGPPDTPEPDPKCVSDDEQVKFDRLKWIAQRDGAAIRRASGLPVK